jgi:hypothetical protein
MNRFVICTSLLFAACASSGDGGHHRPGPGAAERQFAMIKSLEGTWAGKAAHEGGESFPVEVRYRVTAAGSAVEETLFPGTEHEMVTLYHLDGDRLMLTHYCSAGNQPTMVAEKAAEDSKTIRFRFLRATNMRSSADAHMHQAEMTLEGERLRSQWTMFQDGRPTEEARFELTRKSGPGLQALGYMSASPDDRKANLGRVRLIRSGE